MPLSGFRVILQEKSTAYERGLDLTFVIDCWKER